MNRLIPNPKTLIIGSLAALLLALSFTGTSRAAPGTLATSPLFLQSGTVQPNIFFTIDDSGSMGWADLLNNGTFSPGDALYSNSLSGNPPGPYSADTNRRLARLFCRGFNVMAYDPSKTYTPWQGVDSAGIAYQDMTLLSARSNPYSPTSGVNISRHYYWPWNDADGDGEYDGPNNPSWWGGDPASATDECGDVSTLAGGVAVNTLPLIGTTAAPNSQRNYANWYSYYRTREYVVKRALSQIVTASNVRMGLATLHNNNNVLTKVKDVDDVTTPVNTSAQSNKNALLKNLFRIYSSGGTPLRRALRNAGEYYAGNSGWGDSPILESDEGGECQQNFTILMSDGFWNGSDPGVGNTDGDNSSAFDGGAYADTYSNTLADVAMKYYEGDLSPLANNVPTIPGIDENSAQHMVSYTVGFGVNGTLSNSDVPGSSGFSWPKPVANDSKTIDDMRHAAFNGRGLFLSAKDPQQLIDSLSQYIADIQARTGTAAAVSFNSTNLNTGTRVYQALFDSTRWSGDLLAKEIVVDATTGLASISGTVWRASTDIDSRAPSSRQLITYDSGTGLGTNFEWASLNSVQKNDLRTSSLGILDNDAAGMARLGYLRGDRVCEKNSLGVCAYTDSSLNVFVSKSFRARASVLGDIVHSSPSFVGAPSQPYPDAIEPSAPYSAFAISNKSRAGMTYVGSNDGMLHGFDDNGVEIFGYIPASLFSTDAAAGLHYLSDPSYTHRYYVDLSPTVQDAYITVGGTTAWRSILVGGLRGGGKGLFAMDVTDPTALASSAASKVLWEFSDNNLGYTFSDIQIGKMNNGKWAAVLGNGYNSDPNGDGRAKLYILYLDGSNLTAPLIVDTGVGSLDSVSKDCGNALSDCNGLSTPRLVDLNGDGTIDRIYAGDLHGNMWAFNVADKTGTATWLPAYGTDPLFRACTASPCTSANRQPITVKPDVMHHPSQIAYLTRPNLLVFFGTGQYLTQADIASSQKQSFYGVWDSAVGNLDRSSLQPQTITTTKNDAVLGNVRTISSTPVNYSATEKGWLIDLPVKGERSVTNPTAIGSLVFFNTLIPTTSSSNMCSVGGSGWLMSVDMLTGGEPAFIPVDINNDGVFTLADQLKGKSVVGTESSSVSAQSRFASNNRVTAKGDGSAETSKYQPNPPETPARMSWSELDAP